MRVMCCYLFLLCTASVAAWADDGPLDAKGKVHLRTKFAMDSDPELIVPPSVKVTPGNYKPLWLQTLARPEADLQRLSAETIAQAHEFGFPDMQEARPLLVKIIKAAETHPLARFAAARALIVMDSRDNAAELFEASQKHGADLRQLIEPVLATWKHEALRSVYRKRLADADVRHRDLMLAIQGLPHLQDRESLPALLKLVHDPLRPAALRLAAARAAGQLDKSGLESEAKQLLDVADASVANRLCAVALLEQQGSQAAQAHLLQLAKDGESTVVAAALSRLLAIDPELVLPLAEAGVKSHDPLVRERSAAAWIAKPDPARIVLLTPLLDDPHPQVRGTVRDALFELAKRPELQESVIAESIKVLAADSWRGQEQAGLLLGYLDHKPAAPRFVQLLESPRPEVMVTSAWGLRKLAIPETLPAILDKAQRQTTARKVNKPGPPEIDPQVAHLFEAMGVMKHSAAEPLLREHIPKSYDLGEFSRPAAVWSMGHLYAGKPDAELAKQLTARMQDWKASPPEMPLVRGMCAVTVARMGAKTEVAAMREMLGPEIAPVMPSMAFRWSIMQLTGETLPDLVPFRLSKSGFFLTPLDDVPATPSK